MSLSKRSQPKCPVCGNKGKLVSKDVYRCRIGHLFDGIPNEGGTHDDRDPSRRIEREDELTKARSENAARAPRAKKGFRF